MPTFEPRRADPGQEFGYTTLEGDQRTLKADSDGIVRPKDQADQDVLDSFALPHARVASDAPKASRTAAATAARKAKREEKARKAAEAEAAKTGGDDAAQEG
jgi:hypothetical protein